MLQYLERAPKSLSDDNPKFLQVRLTLILSQPCVFPHTLLHYKRYIAFDYKGINRAIKS